MRTYLSSKIHRAFVTNADIDYEGSIGICKNLMQDAGIREYEQVHVLNINNGESFVTYAFETNGGQIEVTGAAARKVAVGDRIIICTYQTVSSVDYHDPRIVLVDTHNFHYRIKGDIL